MTPRQWKLQAAALALAWMAAPAIAEEPAALAQKHQCLACHKVDATLIGPAFKEVAKKYKADPQAEATLVAKVRAGGRGNWGKVPMPPNPAIPEDDLKALVRWVLGT